MPYVKWPRLFDDVDRPLWVRNRPHGTGRLRHIKHSGTCNLRWRFLRHVSLVAHGVAMCRARAKGMEERCCEALRLQHRLSRITGQIDARKCYSKPRAKEKRAEPAPAIGANARALRRSIVSAAWDVVRAGIPDRHTP